MADESTFIIRRVKSRPSRVRDVSPLDDSSAAVPDTLATKLKKKNNQSRLSFGSDDQLSSDGEIFKVKKINLRTVEAAPIPTRSTGPNYTKAYLEELRAITSSTPALQPLIEPSTLSIDDSLGDGAMVAGSTGIFGDTEIPSEASISAAKEKRNRLRRPEAGQDFISLSVTEQGDMNKGPHPESRLMREEDELGEGEDDMQEYTGAQERIALGKKAREHKGRSRKMEIVELINDAEDEDEETIEWERSQVKRAGHIDDSPTNVVSEPIPVYKPSQIPVVTPIPTLATSTARLTSTLTALTTSHASHASQLSTLSNEPLTIKIKERELRQMVENAEQKYSWFSAFQDHMESVANFLDEKFPRLEKLEDENMSLLAERHEMISKRRRTDDEDDIAGFLGVPSAADVTESQETDDLGPVIPSQITTPALRTMRRAERANRRLLRHARNQVPDVQEDEGYSTDGSLPSGDADDYRTALGKLAKRLADLLSDVQREDFKEPKLGLAPWFEKWRDKYDESYVSAWGGLGLVAAWEFWARLEMVGWDPLEDASRGLDSFKWAKELYEYSHPQNDADVEIEDCPEAEIEPGGNMVSSMISQLTPLLCKIIEGGALDPYSEGHVRRVVDVIEQVEASIEADGVRFQSLLKSVLVVFRRAVTETQELLTRFLYAANHRVAFDRQSVAARRRFLARRLKLLRNLIKWRRYTGEQFGVGEMATTLVRTCVLPVLERNTEVEGDVLRMVKEIMPPELVPQEVAMRHG